MAEPEGLLVPDFPEEFTRRNLPIKERLSLADDDFERAAETARTNLGEPHSEKCNALRLSVPILRRKRKTRYQSFANRLLIAVHEAQLVVLAQGL